MAQQIINIGALPNDGEGDPLRTAFQKINDNFTQVFDAGYFTVDATTFDDTANQVIFETPVGLFTQANFQINSSNPDTDDSQNITLDAAISNDGSVVKFTAHSTLMMNSYVVSSYNMDIVDGNVRLLVTPIPDATLNHLIAARINFAVITVGSMFSLNGSDDLLGTENDFIITTEN